MVRAPNTAAFSTAPLPDATGTLPAGLVAFGEHRMMLRPQDDEDRKLLEADIEITPGPADLT